MGGVFLTYAYKSGSFSLSGLVISYSLLLPTLYGIVFLDESTSWLFYIGLLLLCVAIYFISKNKGEKDKKINLKWIISITTAFIANGLCSIIQTAEQNAFEGNYKSEFMIVALLAIPAIKAWKKWRNLFLVF